MLAFLLLAMPAFGFAQAAQPKIISIAYEGGSIMHPGLSVGYGVQLKEIKKWKLTATRLQDRKRSFGEKESPNPMVH